MLNNVESKTAYGNATKPYLNTDDTNMLEINNLLGDGDGETIEMKDENKRVSRLENQHIRDRETSNDNNSNSQCNTTASLKQKLHPETLCPKVSRPFLYISYVLMVFLFWGVLYTLFEDLAKPQSEPFILLALFLVAYLVGQLLRLVRLPPLLGMLLTGIVLRNVGLFNMTGVYLSIVSALRKIALTVILIKAGLGLDAAALRRLSFVVIRLAFTPCIVETITAGVVSHFLLGFPWMWGFLLGFVLAAVSPAVVVPSLLSLKEKGYGEEKGIATLVIAASSIDDILAISGFGVVLGTIFSEGSMTQQILQGPLEVTIGLSFGILWGVIAIYIPHRNDSMVVASRAFMVGGGGLFAVMGSNLIGYDGAGPLAAIVAAFVACCGWKLQGWTSSYNPVEDVFSFIWMIFQPVLFGLIGTEINLSQLDGHTVWLGLAVLFIGLAIRLVTSFLITLGSCLNLKERLFVAVAWFPKATVQAALGPVALDIARHKGADESTLETATQVLTIAVLSILITAPIGAVGIALAGPRLLEKKPVEEAEVTPTEPVV